MDDDVAELFGLLSGGHMTRATAAGLATRFSRQARTAVVARVAAQFAPTPPASLLAGLELIASDEDRPVLVQGYLANLRSPDPLARQASFEGLSRLDYPHLTDLAMAALRDDDDLVVASAVRVLVPQAGDDPHLREFLAGVAAEHAGDDNFHLTNSLLAAHRIGPAEAES